MTAYHEDNHNEDNHSDNAGSDSGSSAAEIEIARLRQELAEALAKSEENLSGWKRAQADFENYRKRVDNESSEWSSFGKQVAFAQIVPVLDSLEQAIIHAPEIPDQRYANWKSGLDGIIKQMDSIMKQIGIEKIEAVGKKFDPSLHEAVREIAGPESGIVAEQYQTGYALNGKVLRPAQVVITKEVENGKSLGQSDSENSSGQTQSLEQSENHRPGQAQKSAQSQDMGQASQE